MEKLYRGPYINAYCQAWFHLAKLFQKRRLPTSILECNSHKIKIHVSEHFEFRNFRPHYLDVDTIFGDLDVNVCSKKYHI